MHKIIITFINLIYENSCLICGESSKKSVVCNACESNFIPRSQNHTKSFQGITVFSWGIYDGKLRDGIMKLKLGKKDLAPYFSERLFDFWMKIPKEIKNKNHFVIGVPSHKRRIKQRGYCQASLIGELFAKKLGSKFMNNFIVRKKETSFMNSLSNVTERVENIKNAFEIVGTLDKEEESILIIDDILTSGSTICELARTIRKRYPKVNLVGLTIASGDTYNLMGN